MRFRQSGTRSTYDPDEQESEGEKEEMEGMEGVPSTPPPRTYRTTIHSTHHITSIKSFPPPPPPTPRLQFYSPTPIAPINYPLPPPSPLLTPTARHTNSHRPTTRPPSTYPRSRTSRLSLPPHIDHSSRPAAGNSPNLLDQRRTITRRITERVGTELRGKTARVGSERSPLPGLVTTPPLLHLQHTLPPPTVPLSPTSEEKTGEARSGGSLFIFGLLDHVYYVFPWLSSSVEYSWDFLGCWEECRDGRTEGDVQWLALCVDWRVNRAQSESSLILVVTMGLLDVPQSARCSAVHFLTMFDERRRVGSRFSPSKRRVVLVPSRRTR
jgi:hypothetical protein